MKTTKQDLELRCARLERTIGPLELALHDVVSGNVTWFGRGDCRIGISRPAGAHGGIVVWQFAGCIAADYWESWSRNQSEHIAACITGENTEANAELMRRRHLIELAGAYVRREQHGIAAA